MFVFDGAKRRRPTEAPREAKRVSFLQDKPTVTHHVYDDNANAHQQHHHREDPDVSSEPFYFSSCLSSKHVIGYRPVAGQSRGVVDGMGFFGLRSCSSRKPST